MYVQLIIVSNFSNFSSLCSVTVFAIVMAMHYIIWWPLLHNVLGFSLVTLNSMHMNFLKMIKFDVLRNRNSRRAFYVWVCLLKDSRGILCWEKKFYFWIFNFNTWLYSTKVSWKNINRFIILLLKIGEAKEEGGVDKCEESYT